MTAADEYQRGIEARYRVEKINDPAGKHDDCRFFVLDPRHDALAREALRLYASRTGYADLRRDLHVWLDEIEWAIAQGDDGPTWVCEMCGAER